MRTSLLFPLCFVDNHLRVTQRGGLAALKSGRCKSKVRDADELVGKFYSCGTS